MNRNVTRTEPFFDRIRTIGWQPFIQIGVQLKASTEFLICHTQQELGPFADSLGKFPHLKHSPFLAGMHAAISLEFQDAGDYFFQWLLNGDSGGVTLEVLDLSHDKAFSRFPLEFPLFVLFEPGTASPQGAAGRAEGLARLISMYDAATSGNDAMRWALMEGAALGLSKYHGHGGDYAAAMAHICIALHYSPKSIHLRAAAHALELILAGSPVPDRLKKFIGVDNGALLDRICKDPFKRFDIGRSVRRYPVVLRSLATDADRQHLDPRSGRRTQFTCRSQDPRLDARRELQILQPPRMPGADT